MLMLSNNNALTAKRQALSKSQEEEDKEEESKEKERINFGSWGNADTSYQQPKIL